MDGPVKRQANDRYWGGSRVARFVPVIDEVRNRFLLDHFLPVENSRDEEQGGQTAPRASLCRSDSTKIKQTLIDATLSR